jgi:glycosyltransferase involved in cell wall biosynthesis
MNVMKREKQNKFDISFVVPIYNMEHYLKDCIDSILAQTGVRYEIILVDDGSTDSSVDICDAYAEQNDYISVIHKKNGGISSARNAGLSAASGDYICFVDSDDFFKCDFSKEFIDICREKNLDIIRGWYGIYDDDRKSYCEHSFPNISYCSQTLTGYEFLIKSVFEHANEVVPWLGFFNREYLLKHQLDFPQGIAYEEDQLFFLQALLCDPKCNVYQSNTEFYAYRKRAGSATKTPTLKQVKDILFVVEQEQVLIKRYALYGQVKTAAQRYICSSFYQLTSIYGRLKKEDAKVAVRLIPFKIKWNCICHPYDNYQQIKIFLFTFARWIVDMVYKRRSL